MSIFTVIVYGMAKRANSDWLVWLAVIGFFFLLLGLFTLKQKLREWFFRRSMEELKFQPLRNVIISNGAPWKLYGKGGAGTAENIYHQVIGGVSVTVFDYTYNTGYGRGRSDYHQTPVLLQPVGERISLPCFSIQPRGLFGAIAGDMRGMFSQVNDADWLNQRYVIEGGSNGSIPGLCPTGLGAVPLAQFLRKHDGLTVESDGIQLLVYRENSRARARALPHVINEALELLEVTTGRRVERVSKPGQ